MKHIHFIIALVVLQLLFFGISVGLNFNPLVETMTNIHTLTQSVQQLDGQNIQHAVHTIQVFDEIEKTLWYLLFLNIGLFAAFQGPLWYCAHSVFHKQPIRFFSRFYGVTAIVGGIAAPFIYFFFVMQSIIGMAVTLGLVFYTLFTAYVSLDAHHNLLKKWKFISLGKLQYSLPVAAGYALVYGAFPLTLRLFQHHMVVLLLVVFFLTLLALAKLGGVWYGKKISKHRFEPEHHSSEHTG